MTAIFPGAVELVITYAGRRAGRLSGRWMASADPEHPERTHLREERRQGRLCVCAALASYYAPALTLVALRHGLAQIEPYMRGHLFDAFGCAALYALVFRQFRHVPQDARKRDPAMSRLMRLLHRLLNTRVQLAAIQLTLASAAIAAASVFAAGGSWWDVAGGGVLAALVLQGFWTGVISGISSAAPAASRPEPAA